MKNIWSHVPSEPQQLRIAIRIVVEQIKWTLRLKQSCNNIIKQQIKKLKLKLKKP